MDFLLISNFFSGLGPGGFIRGKDNYPWSIFCIPGSSHGGIAEAQGGNKPYSGPAYDQQDKESLLGGSGGEINYFSLAWIKVNRQLCDSDQSNNEWQNGMKIG